jgi:hypothetical protein
MHKLKFAVDQKVRVVADEYADDYSHGNEIDSVVTIMRRVKESRKGTSAKDFQEYQLADGSWLTETEIEAIV